MNDYLRYEEFFRDDEDSDERPDDSESADSSEAGAGHYKREPKGNVPLRSSKEEKGADTGTMLLLVLWIFWIVYILFKLMFS